MGPMLPANFFSSFHTVFKYINHDYRDASVRFNICTIESHHRVNDIIFTYKILHNLINCSQLKNKFVYRNLPYPLRDSRRLFEHQSRNDYNFYISRAKKPIFCPRETAFLPIICKTVC